MLRAVGEGRDVRQFIQVALPCDHVVRKPLNGPKPKGILPAAQRPAKLSLVVSFHPLQTSAPPTKLPKVLLSVFACVYICRPVNLYVLVSYMYVLCDTRVCIYSTLSTYAYLCASMYL